MAKTARFFDLTAGQIMTRNVITATPRTSLRSAARLLEHLRISGLPVVDDEGRCIGVLSTTDFLHLFEPGSLTPPPEEHGIFCDWQLSQVEQLPADQEVGTYMTRDPVTVTVDTSIDEISRKMLEKHIHRIVVVDEHTRPIGIVSSTDVLAAVARSRQVVEPVCESSTR